MTGFSAQWLALREPADHRARNQTLLHSMIDYLKDAHPEKGISATSPLQITDLGCGSGSNLRALAESLPTYQHWTLVDYDRALLSAARMTLIEWADQIESNDRESDTSHDSGSRIDDMTSVAATTAPLRCIKNGKYIQVNFRQEDLAQHIERVMSEPTDLVTAAAFFDLVSPAWLVRFCQSLKAPLYTVLTYDGVEKWLPTHSADTAVLEAFHAHQKTDKGFGLSAGPDAINIMQTQLAVRDFDIELAKSPWLLGASDQSLMQALAQGSAGAVAQTGMIAQADLDDWQTTHEHATHCEIGHWDLFATPPQVQ